MEKKQANAYKGGVSARRWQGHLDLLWAAHQKSVPDAMLPEVLPDSIRWKSLAVAMWKTGESPVSLARKLDVEESAIWFWLSGENSPALYRFRMLAEIFSGETQGKPEFDKTVCFLLSDSPFSKKMARKRERVVEVSPSAS